MAKDLFTALKRLSSLTQAPEIGDTVVVEACKELSVFTGGSVIITDGRGKVMAHAGANAAFKLKESVDGPYIDSRTSDRLRDITELTTLQALTDFQFKNIAKSEYCAAILPLYAGSERIATAVVYNDVPLEHEDMALMMAAGAVVALTVRNMFSMEASDRQRDTDAVKLAIGTLSYSELAAVLHVFRELDGGEGLLVASRIADSLGITRSIVVNALRKLEGAGVIETRSLGMKGTYIRILNAMLPEELYKIRK